MKKPTLAILGAVALATTLASTTPASALGGCGPNRHRNHAGYCVFGGQREDYCLRRTGHPSVYGPGGRRFCR